LQRSVRRRHTLLIGFGLGALTVISAAAVANRGALLAPKNKAGTSAASTWSLWSPAAGA